MNAATYSPKVFDVADINQAKRIILTTEGRLTTEQRWRTETPYLVDLIATQVQIDQDSTILDYGCGIGRMSKALIERFGCKVVGVDISPSMRALAAAYVSDDRFLACAPAALEWIWPKYSDHDAPSFDLAIAIWVLQHCNKVEEDVSRIVKNSCRVFVVNDHKRLVPTDRGWSNDGKSVASLMESRFEHGGDYGELDPAHVGEAVASVSYWATWSR